MRVIVAGSTGLVGGALVRECMANPRIAHVYALTRRPLAEDVSASPKVTVVQHDDFGNYPPELLAKLAGAEGCLWAIGGMVSKFPDVETARKVGVDYTLAATNAFLSAGLGRTEEGEETKTFRMVYTSGKFTEWDQNKWLPFLADSRRIKGQVEKGLCDIADNHKKDPAGSCFKVWCVRPGDIMPPNAFVGRRLAAKLADGIMVDRLAAAMVKILLDGHPTRLIEGSEIQKLVP